MKPALSVIVLCLFMNSAFAEDRTPEQIAAQLEIDRIKADTASIEAQTAKFKAEQAAEQARKQSEIDKITAEKNLIDAQNSKTIQQDSTEKAKRQAEIDKLNAQKELIKAATPTITGGATGAVSFDDKSPGTIENTVKAYEAVKTVANTVACNVLKGTIEKPKNGNVKCNSVPDSSAVYIILSTNDTSAITRLSVFEAQADLIRKRLETLNGLNDNAGLKIPTETSSPQSAAEVLGLAGPAITALTGLVGLFRVEDKYVPHDETADVPAVYGAVANAMRVLAPKVTIYYPEILPASLFEKTSPVQQTLTGIITALDTLRATYYSRLGTRGSTAKLIADLDDKIKEAPAVLKTLAEIKAIQDEIAKLGTSAQDLEKKKKLEETIAEKRKLIPEGAIDDPTLLRDKKKYLSSLKNFADANDKYIALLEPILAAGDSYLAALLTADATSTTPLSALMTAERLRRIYIPNAFAVQLSVQRLAGTRKEHKNFFGTSLSFSGGVVISYRLFDSTSGKFISSDTVSEINQFSKN